MVKESCGKYKVLIDVYCCCNGKDVITFTKLKAIYGAISCAFTNYEGFGSFRFGDDRIAGALSKAIVAYNQMFDGDDIRLMVRLPGDT